MIPTKIAIYLALNKISGFGIKHICHLENHYSDITALVNCSNKELEQLGWKEKHIQEWRNLSWKTIEEGLKWAEQPNCYILHWHDDKYPRILKEIHHPPVILYVKGQVDALTRMNIGVVGSRHPTPYGKTNSENFSRQLAELGFCITSGLAIGIDGIAHQASLSYPTGTVAVVATGLDQVYPERHRKLAQSILKNGAIVSEFPFKTSPRPENFPRRNRIISGLSRGIIVIEAALKSGSLITARYAMEQGREVFAIPGIIQNPQTEGCHALIRQGAILVNNVEQILEELNFSPLRVTREETKDSLSTQVSLNFPLLSWMDFGIAISIDKLVELSGLPADSIMSQLLELELSEYIQKLPEGGYIRFK